MGKERSNIRQRINAAEVDQICTAKVEEAEPSSWQKANFYFAQHIGLVVCAIGLSLILLGYGKGWMHDTHLMMLSLGICLVGLFFHETRPFNAQHIYEEEAKAKSQAAR